MKPAIWTFNESPLAIAAGSGTISPGSISISKAYPNNDIETYAWNTDQLKNTVNMFKNQISFNQDISKWKYTGCGVFGFIWL